MKADLHIHSVVSDGSYTPSQILAKAKENGVGVLAVCDHDLLEGTRETLRLAKTFGVRAIAGIELDSLYHGVDFHILGLNVDPQNPALCHAAKQNRAALDGMNDDLIRAMRLDGYAVSLPEFRMFTYDHALGGWDALHYLVHKGLAKDVYDAMRYYKTYSIAYGSAPFYAADEVCAVIKAAGGVPILAHPGVDAYPAGEEPLAVLRALVTLGIEGLECYYPKHTLEQTKSYLALCEELDLSVTAGSDCHGPFSGGEIGSTDTDIRQLRLPFAIDTSF